MKLRSAFKVFYTEYTRWFKSKRPRDILLSAVKLGEETGEVLEAVYAFSSKSKRKIKKLLDMGHTPKTAIREELGDVIVVCLNIATLCGISHTGLFEAAAEKANKRTAELMEKKNK